MCMCVCVCKREREQIIKIILKLLSLFKHFPKKPQKLEVVGDDMT